MSNEPEADATAVIQAAITRNNDAATELETKANDLENQVGEARKRASEYRDASASLEQTLKAPVPKPALPAVKAAKAAPKKGR